MYPLLQLANRSAALLAIGEHMQAPDYRARLINRGLVSANRDINAQKLKSLIREVFRDDLSGLGLRPSDESLDWAALMVRPGAKFCFAPLKHLVLQTAIDLARQDQRIDHVPSGLGKRYGSSHDEAYAKAVQMRLQEAIKTGQHIGVRQTLHDIGAWEPYRHDRERFPLTQTKLKELRRSGVALRRLRRRMSLAN